MYKEIFFSKSDPVRFFMLHIPALIFVFFRGRNTRIPFFLSPGPSLFPLIQSYSSVMRHLFIFWDFTGRLCFLWTNRKFYKKTAGKSRENFPVRLSHRNENKEKDIFFLNKG